MNIRKIFSTLGQIVLLEGALMLLPAVTALIYGETATLLAFLGTVVIAGGLGSLLLLLNKKADQTIYAKEGFVITALAWIVMSAVGALPFVFSGDIPSYVDAFFETVSGFTTTGASILTDVTAMSKGCLFWRSFTHWIGGMGVLVLMMAIMPDNNGRSIHIMRAEMPGPIVDKIVPKVRGTAKILYLMYVVLTAVEVLFLLGGGMNLLESLLHAFGTAGTGGFGIMPDSLGSYSAYHQWVIAIFMVLFGVNFNLYFLILLGRFRQALRSEELWVYLGIIGVAIALVTANISGLYDGFGESLRHAAFQVASVMTTTGYSSVDFNLWPAFSKTILVLLMFIGGCAGSTAGGLKVSRAMILGKSVRCELKRLIHPRSVAMVRLEGKKLDESTRQNVGAYFALYALSMAAVLLLVSLDGFDFETNATATISCFNNIGPGLGGVGPMASFAQYSPFSKLVLSAAMLFGRLELYPMIILLTPQTWLKK